METLANFLLFIKTRNTIVVLKLADTIHGALLRNMANLTMQTIGITVELVVSRYPLV